MKPKNWHRPLPSILILSVGILFTISIAANSTAEDSAAGADIFKTKCVTCHGQDGSGTAVGKSLKVADLRSAEVQSKSDAELTQVISDGKNNMPGFKGNITDEEIQAVLAHVRTLGKKK
jgi:cytochrome c6